MKVYAVMHGSRHEGGDLHSIHASRESATAAVNLLLKAEADELVEFRLTDPWWDDSRFEYREVGPGAWENNGGYISIVEHELAGLNK